MQPQLNLHGINYENQSNNKYERGFMPDNKGNLYLFEAVELRNEYDRHIKLIERLLGFDDEESEPVDGFNPKELEDRLKKLKSKRIKLNQAIQLSNYETEIEYDGEKISIAEALEIRKSLIDDNKILAQRVTDSAYKRVIHKEERDIILEPKYSFVKTYDDFQNTLKRLRQLITHIHIANHQNIVKFKDE